MYNLATVQVQHDSLDPAIATLECAKRQAECDVYRLLDELAPSLDARQRRLLGELRLAAETLGGLRAGLDALAGVRW